MTEREALLGNNRIDDVRWLCSLTESELDLVMGLKVLIQQRAKVIGREYLAEKFDLKTLRALSFILMENFKGKLKDLSSTPETAKSSAMFDACNLLNCELDKNFANMEIEQLNSYFCSDTKKRIKDMDLCPGFLNSDVGFLITFLQKESRELKVAAVDLGSNFMRRRTWNKSEQHQSLFEASNVVGLSGFQW